MFGAVHAFILPVVPYLLWLYAIMACVTLAAEILVAAPLAALLHVRADGQDFVNAEQKTIYTILFNALLRPSLLLFGLVLANTAFAVMAVYLNKTLSMALLSSQGDSIVGPIGLISFLILTFYLHYQLAVRSMSLVHQVPSMVSELLGARDQSRGEENDSTKVMGAVVNMTRTAGNQAVVGAFTPKPPKAPNDPGTKPGATPAATDALKPQQGGNQGSQRGEEGRR